MNYGSVCSGVEAATLAWKELAWQAKFFAEVEPFPSAVLMERFGATRPLRPLDPAEAASEKDRKTRESWQKQIAELSPVGKIPNLGDFTKIKETDYDGHIDLLVGGFPCQSFSLAGARRSLADPRGMLALEFINLAYRLHARIVLGENVPGLLSIDEGETFATFLSLMCGWRVTVPEGGWNRCGIVTNTPGHYGVAWRILDAQYTRVSEFPRALPQRRRRLFIIGHLDNWQYPAQVLFDGEMCGGNTPPSRTKRQRLAACTESCIDTAKWWDGTENAGTLTTTSNNQLMPDKARLQCVLEEPECLDMRQIEVHKKGVSPTLIATDYKGGKAVCFQQNSSDEVRLMRGDGEVAGAVCTVMATKQQNHLCYENHPQDCRVKEVDVGQTVVARLGTGGNNGQIVQEPIGFIKNDAGGEQQGYWEGVFPTMRTEIIPAVVQQEVFALDSEDSNSMKSSNPNSGFHTTEVAKTLDTTNPDPNKKQGGMAVVECINVSFCDVNGKRKDRPNGGLYITDGDASKTVTTGGVSETMIVALDGDKMAKADRKGGSGLGVSDDGVMYTQTVKDVHAVAYEECVPVDLRNATRDPEKYDAVNRQGVGIGKDGDPMTTVSASNVPGVGYRATVRRLLPLETERLMGFPDNHTRIPWKDKPEEECPDAPRYKACGNSMAVNVMSWLGQRIQMVEKSASREANYEIRENEHGNN